MKLREFKLLTDANIDADVVAHLSKSDSTFSTRAAGTLLRRHVWPRSVANC